MNGALRIERLYFAEYDGDLVIEYEVTDGRGDWAYVLRMDQPLKRFKWVTPISGSEAIGPGLIEGRDLYLSAVNVLAKIDMQTGAIGWQQSDFEHVSMFGLPTIKADSILFQDDYDSRRRIEIDKLPGQAPKALTGSRWHNRTACLNLLPSTADIYWTDRMEHISTM
jgi:hypothetical protein